MPTNIKKRRHWFYILVITLLLAGGALTVAYAQSGTSAFNLNSPASFPVDI
jgi:hypothetical protein